MRKLARRRNKTKAPEEEGRQSYNKSKSPSVDNNGHLGVFYSSGPMHELGGKHDKSKKQIITKEEIVNQAITEVSGKGSSAHHSAESKGRKMRLNGRTEADFDGGKYETKNTKVQSATGCESCNGNDCIHVIGTLVARYHVKTIVTLPKVSDYPDLTKCQKIRIRNAIMNVLAPHEQQHVRAFRQYNGVTRQQFDLTLCRSEFDGKIKAIFENEEKARRAAAKAASEALDPFYFDVDLNCDDKVKDKRAKQNEK